MYQLTGAIFGIWKHILCTGLEPIGTKCTILSRILELSRILLFLIHRFLLESSRQWHHWIMAQLFGKVWNAFVPQQDGLPFSAHWRTSRYVSFLFHYCCYYHYIMFRSNVLFNLLVILTWFCFFPNRYFFKYIIFFLFFFSMICISGNHRILTLPILYGMLIQIYKIHHHHHL